LHFFLIFFYFFKNIYYVLNYNKLCSCAAMARPLHLPPSPVTIIRDSKKIPSFQKIPVPIPAGFLFLVPANSGSGRNCILWFRCIPSFYTRLTIFAMQVSFKKALAQSFARH